MERTQTKLPSREQLVEYAKKQLKLTPIEIATCTDRRLYELISAYVRKTQAGNVQKSTSPDETAPAESKAKPVASCRILSDPPAPVTEARSSEVDTKVADSPQLPQNSIIKTLHRISGRYLPNLAELQTFLTQLEDERSNSYFTESELRLVRQPIIKRAISVIQHAYEFRQKRILLLKSEGADIESISNLQRAQEELRQELNQILEHHTEQSVLQEKQKETSLLDGLFV